MQRVKGEPPLNQTTNPTGRQLEGSRNGGGLKNGTQNGTLVNGIQRLKPAVCTAVAPGDLLCLQWRETFDQLVPRAREPFDLFSMSSLGVGRQLKWMGELPLHPRQRLESDPKLERWLQAHARSQSQLVGHSAFLARAVPVLSWSPHFCSHLLKWICLMFCRLVFKEICHCWTCLLVFPRRLQHTEVCGFRGQPTGRPTFWNQQVMLYEPNGGLWLFRGPSLGPDHHEEPLGGTRQVTTTSPCCTSPLPSWGRSPWPPIRSPFPRPSGQIGDGPSPQKTTK